MNPATMRDIGALLAAACCGAVDATAGGSGDATEVDGQWIDRQDYLSGKLVIVFKTTLAEDKTLSIAANMQDASDSGGTGAADYGDALANAVFATGGTGGSTEYGVAVLDVDLSGAKQYVRAQFTPDLSATGTDTAIVAAGLILGGADQVPVS